MIIRNSLKYLINYNLWRKMSLIGIELSLNKNVVVEKIFSVKSNLIFLLCSHEGIYKS